MFLTVSLFPLTSGTRLHVGQTVSYKTAVACFQTAPVDTVLHVPSAPEDGVLDNGTVAFVIGKTFISPPHSTRPIAIDSIQIAPIPSNPSDPMSYHSQFPHYPVPTIIAQGAIAPATATDPSAVPSFALAVSDYVRACANTSTMLSVSLHYLNPVNMLTVSHSQLPLYVTCDAVSILPYCCWLLYVPHSLRHSLRRAGLRAACSTVPPLRSLTLVVHTRSSTPTPITSVFTLLLACRFGNTDTPPPFPTDCPPCRSGCCQTEISCVCTWAAVHSALPRLIQRGL